MTVDQQIQSKIKALNDLTRKVNEARDEYERVNKDLNQKLENRVQEIYEELSEWEMKKINPEKGIKLIEKELSERETSIIEWEEELNKLSNRLDERQESLDQMNLAVTESLDTVMEAWDNLISNYSNSIKGQAVILKKRAESLDKQEESVKKRFNALNDQIRTFKASQSEILRNNNG